MKVAKGDAGYIRARKRKILLKTVLEFGIVVALLILGIIETGSRQNLLTVVAILGCLPASKALVELIMVLPHHSISEEMAAEMELNASLLTRVYDMVFTSEKIIMPVEAIVISGNTICGYSSNAKVDINFITKHLNQYLHMNRFDKVSVKIFDNYTAFATRAEGMNNIAAIEKEDTKRHEEGIRQILLNISI
jgi:hypothetical protein